MISIQELLEKMTIADLDSCGYFKDQHETILAIRCPLMPNELHGPLIEIGFRHSGDLFYRPQCRDCHKCIPMRIDPTMFRPSKKQRHIFNKNSDVEIYLLPPEPTKEKYDIYQRYMDLQHPESDEGKSFVSMRHIFARHQSTCEIQYRIENRIAGITIADILPNAFSSVYHFFDPDFARRSIGVFSMIAEIRLCENMLIPYYYPGL